MDPTYDFAGQVALVTGGSSGMSFYELRQMRAQGSGAIVNCSSMPGWSVAPAGRPTPRRSAV
jgi:NAD(P)-dependent dehydrogenase (short-subunit alcohol dehydrogenase family)